MPRPTAAQLAYGSATVILSTLAILLLSRTESGFGMAFACAAALVLGLLVAMTVPVPKHVQTVRGNRSAEGRAAAAARTQQALDDIGPVLPAAPAGERAGEHSLRR
ncbi:hypothetical protein OHA98_33790 [Streptomyces sp. NBC_00654]|uniref:hypothetical protein n=1 Tax=Streptomyces sp. NBC_00654 TaxID=2975799 RepID=UPI00224FBB82|nr:hypothetical protein [Streptomyces sp. NBC_00654]MCX4969643.1 hypothetical protein [Streptomyces sp. NBC_00654]